MTFYKTKTVCLCLTLVISLCMPQMAIAENHYTTLKSNIEIGGDVVTLQDLFTDAGTASQTIVMQAPAPGKRLSLSPHFLATLASDHGLIWRNPASLEHIIITRSSQSVPVAIIKHELADALRTEGAPELLDIHLSKNHLSLHVDRNEDPTVAISDLTYNETTGVFEAFVRAPADNTSSAAQRISGRAYTALEIPTLVDGVQPGETITSSNISLVLMRVNRIGRTIITNANDLVGKEAKRRLSPRQPVRRSDVKRPMVISKGALVAIRYETRGIILTAEGRALSEGGQGEMVRVMNTRSNRTVQATVMGPNQVSVSPAFTQLSAN